MADDDENAEAQEDGTSPNSVEAVYDVPIEMTAVLGTATMKVSQLLKLGRGAVVELNQRVEQEIELRANDRLIARGDVVVVEEHLGVTMTEIIKTNISKT
ncbi:MAG: FliM/FliN family flagellar motor switch protein [Rhodospirillales bacterium]|nr:FliM/FliN family flagellar motor switch protein [Rhodospirillales bacterium]